MQKISCTDGGEKSIPRFHSGFSLKDDNGSRRAGISPCLLPDACFTGQPRKALAASGAFSLPQRALLLFPFSAFHTYLLYVAWAQMSMKADSSLSNLVDYMAVLHNIDNAADDSQHTGNANQQVAEEVEGRHCGGGNDAEFPEGLE
jgi:hypothetical protein